MSKSLDIKIRLLNKNDDRSNFNSGNIELDRFFQRYAGQNQFRHYVGSTYIALSDNTIVGYITVSPNEITAENIPTHLKKKLPEYPLPILRIARLAVNKNFQGYGIGKQLLKAMLEIAINLRQTVGCIGVVVDAKPEAIIFYEKLGFIFLATIKGNLDNRPIPTPMFLPMQTIMKAAQKDD